MIVDLKEFGPIISTQEKGEKMYSKISKALAKDNILEIDFKNVISMATFCAKQVFGKLYLELSSEVFFQRLKFKNTSKDIQLIIKMGIQSALDEHQ